MARNDAGDPLYLAERSVEGVRKGDAASAVCHVNHRRGGLQREQISQVCNPVPWQRHDQIPVGVTGPEVVQVDALPSVEQRHLVPNGLVGQELGIAPREGVHLLHGRPGVFVRDDIDHTRERDIAAGVVDVRVCVDNRRDRPLGHQCDRIHDGRGQGGCLAVDEDDALVANERDAVAGAVQQIQHRAPAQ